MVSQPMAAASAMTISRGWAFFTSRMTARTTSGLVHTEVSAGEAWPALGFRNTTEPFSIRLVTPPIRSKTLVTLSCTLASFARATNAFLSDI